jgi:hypothetical protein
MARCIAVAMVIAICGYIVGAGQRAQDAQPELRAVLATPEGCVLYRARGGRELFVCPAGIHGELRT